MLLKSCEIMWNHVKSWWIYSQHDLAKIGFNWIQIGLNRVIKQSSVAPEVHIDLDSVGDIDGGDGLHLRGGALQIDVPLEDGHLPVVPSLGSLTAGRSSAADAQMLVWEADWTIDFDLVGLSVADQLVGDLLNACQLAATERDPCSLYLCIFNSLLLCVFISHWI